MSVNTTTLQILDTISYISMVIALGTGCVIILGAMFKGIKAEKTKEASEATSYKKAKAS
jgi:ABC-type lipoprotein release transport system permease subunit